MKCEAKISMPLIDPSATNHSNFGILPNNGEEEILNQIQQLLTLTLQNQAAINKIVGVLEKQGTPVTLSSSSPTATQEDDISHQHNNKKGKSPLLSTIREDKNPFEE